MNACQSKCRNWSLHRVSIIRSIEIIFPTLCTCLKGIAVLCFVALSSKWTLLGWRLSQSSGQWVGAGQEMDAYLLRACYFKAQGQQRWLGGWLWCLLWNSWPPVAMWLHTTPTTPQRRWNNRRCSRAEKAAVGATERGVEGSTWTWPDELSGCNSIDATHRCEKIHVGSCVLIFI